MSPTVAPTHAEEIRNRERFTFGENWASFLTLLDEARIARAVDNLKAMLEVDDLSGKTFLDIGSGSGLSSLAARRMGARVVSFDYDPQSVACTRELKRRYFENDADWQVQSGSVLDTEFLESLGTFDVVYSWGVLHHTGAMWQALANVDARVAANGRLFIAIYDDQDLLSRRWNTIKRTYVRLPELLKMPFAFLVYLPIELKTFFSYLRRLKPQVYFSQIRHYGNDRGMSWWHDKIDWIGGYPFEVARPEEIFNFFRKRGYDMTALITSNGGCNQFVFKRRH